MGEAAVQMEWEDVDPTIPERRLLSEAIIRAIADADKEKYGALDWIFEPWLENRAAQDWSCQWVLENLYGDIAREVHTRMKRMIVSDNLNEIFSKQAVSRKSSRVPGRQRPAEAVARDLIESARIREIIAAGGGLIQTVCIGRALGMDMTIDNNRSSLRQRLMRYQENGLGIVQDGKLWGLR